jgi:hypothetical protein
VTSYGRDARSRQAWQTLRDCVLWQGGRRCVAENMKTCLPILGLLLLTGGLVQCSAVLEPHLRCPNTARQQPERLIAIGGLHGDVAATRRALRLAGVLDPHRDVWTGGTTVGNQIDRGDDELHVLALLHSLSRQARVAGGALEVLCGNHEVLASMGKFRYATPGHLFCNMRVDIALYHKYAKLISCTSYFIL